MIKKSFLTLLLSTPCFGVQEFEVLRPYSLGQDVLALNGKKTNELAVGLHSYLVDAEISSAGTGTKNYDRTLVNRLRLSYDLHFNDRFSLRPTFEATHFLNKIEGANEPRLVRKEGAWLARPSMIASFSTANNLDLFVEYTYQHASKTEAETKSVSLTATEEAPSIGFGYLSAGFVKKTSKFTGGFSFIKGGEASRVLTKENDRDDTVITTDDVIYEATQFAIFAAVPLSSWQIYGEFSAVQAGSGGPRTEEGATTKEDYIRLLTKLETPEILPSVRFASTLIYKTLSYADNRNVSIESIPQSGLHLDAISDSGPLGFKAGIVLSHGRDGQSLEEFNADYKIFSYGLHFSALLKM